jgi:hypothetical protein
MTKYGAIRTEVDGITFASKAEARRYAELKLMERAGVIRDLVLQPRYELCVTGERICWYVADFAYTDNATDAPVVEDVKGVKTSVYRLKKKLMYACKGITVQEVTA